MRTLRIALIALLAALGLGACARLLGYRSAERAPFAHRAHVTKGIGCLTCHTGVDKAGGEGPLHLPDTATCVKCHQKPHDNISFVFFPSADAVTDHDSAGITKPHEDYKSKFLNRCI